MKKREKRIVKNISGSMDIIKKKGIQQIATEFAGYVEKEKGLFILNFESRN